MIKNITLGQYFPGDSLIHRLDARTKLLVSIAIIVLVFVAKTWWGYLAIAALLLLAGLLSRVSLRMILRGLKPIWWILVITFIMNLFFFQGETVIARFWIITLTREALLQAVKVAIRLVLLILSTTALTLTTSPMEITAALEKLLAPLKIVRFPVHEMALMMSIALRFIPTLVEETDRIMKAQTARGAEFDSGNLMKKAAGLIPLLVPLFISAYKRAEELAVAMEARCYNGAENRTSMRLMRFHLPDLVCALVMAGLVAFYALGY